MESNQHQNITAREFDGSGRFRHDCERMCVCGHANGEHAALRPKPCFAGCECQKFRAKRLSVRERIMATGRVAELWSETGHRDDGRACWWLRYADGWVSADGRGGEHEDTLTEILRCVRAALPQMPQGGVA